MSDSAAMPPPNPPAPPDDGGSADKPWWQRWYTLAGAAFVALLVIAAIAGGGSDDDDSEGAAGTTTAVSVESSAPAETSPETTEATPTTTEAPATDPIPIDQPSSGEQTIDAPATAPSPYSAAELSYAISSGWVYRFVPGLEMPRIEYLKMIENSPPGMARFWAEVDFAGTDVQLLPDTEGRSAPQVVIADIRAGFPITDIGRLINTSGYPGGCTTGVESTTAAYLKEIGALADDEGVLLCRFEGRYISPRPLEASPDRPEDEIDDLIAGLDQNRAPFWYILFESGCSAFYTPDGQVHLLENSELSPPCSLAVLES